MSELWKLWIGLLTDLKESVKPGGPSTTKVIYVATGVAGLIAASFMSYTLCGMYILHRSVDTSFAGAVSAIWVVVFGFASNVQNKKAHADKEIEVSKSSGASKQKLPGLEDS